MAGVTNESPATSQFRAGSAAPLPRRFLGFTMSPINRRRWTNFESNRRGYWSLWLFLALFLVTLPAEFVANDKPLLVRFDGGWYMPVLSAYPETEFGGVFEHSPWIAEGAHALELGPTHDTARGVHAALARVFRSASQDRRLGVLTAHPDLAGKLAEARRLTADSTAEQASVGLNALTDAERRTFTELNDAYTSKFGFPFIIAVRDNTKASILKAFQRRAANDRETEFAEACRQVERIAELRLLEKLGE